MESIVAGIVSGLLVALFITFFRTWWKNVLEPWYENRVYVDVKIEGHWIGRGIFEDAGEQEFAIHLKRTGHSIYGTVTGINGRDKGVVYDIQGTFRNLILTATWVAADRNILDLGTASMRLLPTGKKLEGYNTYFDEKQNKILTCHMIWERDPSASAAA